MIQRRRGIERRRFKLWEVVYFVGAHPLEFIVAAAIIGIVMHNAAYRLDTPNRARIGATKAGITALKSALNAYLADCGSFPTTHHGLQALANPSGGMYDKQWLRYLEQLQTDAWQTPFKYACPSTHGQAYDLSSAGPDKQHGTADDIANWKDDREAGEKN